MQRWLPNAARCLRITAAGRQAQKRVCEQSRDALMTSRDLRRVSNLRDERTSCGTLRLMLVLLNNGWGRCWPLSHGRRRRHPSLARLLCNWWWRAGLSRSLPSLLRLPMVSRTVSRHTGVRTSSPFENLYRVKDVQDCGCVAADHRVGARCPQCGRHSVMATEVCHLEKAKARTQSVHAGQRALRHCVPHPSTVPRYACLQIADAG